VVSNGYTEVTKEEKSEEAFWTTRLDFMLEVNEITNYLHQFFCCSRSDEDLNSNSIVSYRKIRKVFAHYDNNWIKNECTDDEMKNFFHWWYYSWKKKEPPSMRTRLGYFYKYASMEEILVPGKVFRNIVFGLKHNEDVRGWKLLMARLFSPIHMVVGLIILLLLFFLGLVTFGLLWSPEIKQKLFSGTIEAEKKKKEKTGNPDQKEKIEALEYQVRNLEQQKTDMQQQNNEIIRNLEQQKTDMQQQNNEIIRNLEQQKTDMQQQKTDMQQQKTDMQQQNNEILQQNHKILSILSKTQKNQEELGSDISVETN
jgi:hypothetical protein